MGWKPNRHRYRAIPVYQRTSMMRSTSGQRATLSKPFSFLISIILLVSLTNICSATTLNNSPDQNYGKDNGQSSSAWQYAQQSAAPSHHEKTYDGGHGHYVGTRQGALIGSPLYGVFPIIFLIGLAAIIIIPLLFFTFSPMGFAGGYGQSAFAKKRSLLDEWDGPSLRKNILDLIVTVSDAIEKYGGPFLAEQANVKAKKKA